MFFVDSDFVAKVKKQYSKSKIENIWENRFHNPIVDWGHETTIDLTHGWMFFISRPGMELTRKLDTKGQQIFDFYRREIKRFLNEKGSAKEWMRRSKPNELFTQTRTDPKTKAFITFTWPFSLADEAPSKTGVMFHLGRHPEVEETPQIQFTPSSTKGPFSMFDAELQKAFSTKFELPPGVNVHPSSEDGQDLQWSNFASSKIFPTNSLLQETDWVKFRNLMSLQFIEVRLLDPLEHIGDVLGEQVDALDKFQRHGSGFSSFSGAPGTGKSTLLHMICADRIAKNWAEGSDQRIMYYVPSSALKTEATRELHAILEYVYSMDPELCVSLVSKYFYPVMQEDLYLENLPPSSFDLTSPASDKKIAEFIPEFKHLTFPLNDKDAQRGRKISQFKEYLRRFVYGVFEDYTQFQNWQRGRRQLPQYWSSSTINLYSIDGKPASQMKHMPFTPHRFVHVDAMDEFLKYATNVNSHINGDGKNTQFWDPTTMVVGAYRIGLNDEQLWKGTVWDELKGKADYIVIDEVQDITLTEARILLKHFSNRQPANQLRPFRFIIAGDAYQNIKQLIFVPDNKHMHSLFEDWRSQLGNQFAHEHAGGHLLSEGLKKTSTYVLRASYRTHDEMLPSIAQIMKNIREIDAEEYKKGVDATAKATPFGRDGLILIGQSKGKKLTSSQKKQQEEWKEEIIRTLNYQFDVDPEDGKMSWNHEAANKEIQVSYCYDQNDADWKTLSMDRGDSPLHPLSKLLSKKDTVWHHALNDLLENFTNLFRQRVLNEIDADQHYDPAKLWRTEAEARGVFTIQQIKGLTLPITITQPPKAFSTGLNKQGFGSDVKGASRSDWSKLLVELTRAQYVNVLMENHNALPNLEAHFVSHIQEPTSITRMLYNVARFSTGYVMPLEQAFFIALNNHENPQTWIRLQELVGTHPDPRLNFFAEWPRKVLLALYNKSGDGIAYNKIEQFLEFKAGRNIQFCLQNEKFTLDEISSVEKNNLLGNRFSIKSIASLLIFLQCNHAMRERIRGSDDTFDASGVRDLVKLWLDAHENQTTTEEWGPSWFKYILGAKEIIESEHGATVEKKNLIEGLIEKTFSNPLEPIQIEGLVSQKRATERTVSQQQTERFVQEPQRDVAEQHRSREKVSIDWRWPTLSFPRLHMGSWHLVNKRMEPLESESERVWDESAWMREGQSYYTMPMHVMRKLIEDASVKNKQKLLMLIAMTELDHELFWSALKNHLVKLVKVERLDDATQCLDWFVKLLKKYKPAEEDHELELDKSQFLENVRKLLEEYLNGVQRNDDAVRRSVSNLIGRAENREELLTRLEALAFENWSSTVSVLNSLENSVLLSSQAILEHNEYLRTFLKKQEILQRLMETRNSVLQLPEESSQERSDLLERERNLEEELKLIDSKLKREGALYGIRQSVQSRPAPLANDYAENGAFWNFFHGNGQLKEPTLLNLFASLAHVPELTGGRGFESIHSQRLKIPSFDTGSPLAQALVVCLNYWSEMDGEEQASAKFTEFVVKSFHQPTNDNGQLKSLLEFILSCNKFVSLTNKLQDKALRETPYFSKNFYEKFRTDLSYQGAMASFLFSHPNSSNTPGWQTLKDLFLSEQAKIVFALVADSIQSMDDYSIQRWRELKPPSIKRMHPLEVSEHPIRLDTIFVPLEHYAHVPISRLETDEQLANMTHLHSMEMFQGFACVADIPSGDYGESDSYQDAIKAFTRSGHHHYVAALRLLAGYKTFDEAKDKEKAAWEMLDILIDLLAMGRERLISNLYLGLEYNEQNEKIRASNYGMNFVPPKSQPLNFRKSGEWRQSIFSKSSFLGVDKLVKVKKTEKIQKQARLNPNMQIGLPNAQNTNPKGTKYTVETFSGMKNWEVVRNNKTNEIIQYLRFHHTMENMEQLSRALASGRKNGATPSETLNSIDRTTYTTLKDNLGAYLWKYNPVKGFVPEQDCMQSDGTILKILDFFQRVVNTQNPLSFMQFKKALCEFTKVEGMMKEWIQPTSRGEDEDTNLDTCLNDIRNSTNSLPEEERDKYIQGIDEIVEWVRRKKYLADEKKNLGRINTYISDYELPERVAMIIRNAWNEYRRHANE